MNEYANLLIGSQLHRFSSTVQLSELVYVFLRLQQMERSVQAHKSRYATNESSAVGCCRIPHRRSLLKMLDISKDLLGVSLIQIDAIAGRQILLVKITIARPRLRGDKYDMSQDIRQLVAGRSQTRDLDLLFARLSVPDKCMTVGCCRAGTKINVVGSCGRSSINFEPASHLLTMAALGATAAMVTACFIADLGRASCC